jgi:hypothetical protein
VIAITVAALGVLPFYIPDCSTDLKVKFSPREKAIFNEIQVASMNVIVEFDIKMLICFQETTPCLP